MGRVTVLKSLDDVEGELSIVEETPQSAGDVVAMSAEDTGATSTEALFNTVSILMGVGILSIPYALNEGGWATLGVLLVIWLATNHTGKLLIKCQEYYKRRPDEAPKEGSGIQLRQGVVQTYEDIAALAFGSGGRKLMTAVLYTELVGTCALFLILEKDHVNILIESLPQLQCLSGISDNALMMASAALFIPTTWLPDLSALSYISVAGMLSSFALTGLVLYTYLSGQPFLVDTALIHPQSLPVTFGLIAFVFAGHAVFPIIYSGMKRSEQPKFTQVLDLTYVIVGAACLAIGAAGYSAYGSGALEEVTANLPVGPLQLIGTSLILVAPFSKFALTLEPVASGADSALGVQRTALSGRVIRTSLGLFSLLLAARVPFFGTFMSLLGSFLTLTVSVMFPAGAYLKIYWDELSEVEKRFNYGVIFIGAICTVTGTLTALQAVTPTEATDAGSSAAAVFSIQELLAQGPPTPSVLKQLVCNSLCAAQPLRP